MSPEENRVTYQLGHQAKEMLHDQTKSLFESKAYRKFTNFPAFMMGRSQDWVSQLVKEGFVSWEEASNPEAIAKSYQKEAASFGKKLYDLIRVAADGKEGSQCDFCGNGVYGLGQDTAFSKMAHLEQIPSNGDPDLFWRDEYVLNCKSCGGHSVVDITEVTKAVNLDLMYADSVAVTSKLKDKNLREIIDMTLDPFRHGIRELTKDVSDKLEE